MLRRLRCWLRGHPITVCNLEVIHGRTWHTYSSCDCGQRVPVFPGAAVKTFMEEYERLPTEYPLLFEEKP
jgi:hypothetical protein